MQQLNTKPICETCLHLLDGATAADGTDAEVRPGDLGVCFYCCEISIYTKGFNLRKITAKELREVKEKYPENYRLLMSTVILIKARTKMN